MNDPSTDVQSYGSIDYDLSGITGKPRASPLPSVDEDLGQGYVGRSSDSIIDRDGPLNPELANYNALWADSVQGTELDHEDRILRTKLTYKDGPPHISSPGQNKITPWSCGLGSLAIRGIERSEFDAQAHVDHEILNISTTSGEQNVEVPSSNQTPPEIIDFELHSETQKILTPLETENTSP